MKLKSFLVMLLCMVLFTAAVTAAEEAAVIVAEDSSDETAGVVEDTTVIIAGDASDEAANVTDVNQTVLVVLFSGEAPKALATIDNSLMMATEEAFDYLLTGDAEEKQIFLDEMASVKEDNAAFEEAFDLTAEEAAEVKALHDDLLAAADAMGMTGETMFATYEADNAVNPEEVEAFEEQVDIVSDKIDAMWALHSASKTEPSSIESFKGQLISSLLLAAEETYAYPVIGNVTEKEDALASFAQFDTTVAEAEELYPDESFEDLKTVKANMLTAAETMFATYEADGKVNPDEVEAFETELEAFTDTFVIVIPIEETKEVIVVTEPVTETT